MKKFTFLFIFIFVVSVFGNSSEHLLHYVTDDVPGGSYKYYSLMHSGLIKIQLISQSGDADIYVSQTTTKPTYEPDRYCLQSTTCGEDFIFIPESFKRPVTIGVYGHPSHEISRYNLLVYQATDLDDNVLDKQYSSDNPQEPENSKKKKTSFVLTIFWSLLEILLHVLF